MKCFYDSFMSIVVNKYNMKTLIKIWLKNHNSFILILYHQKNNELELYSSCEICLPANTFIDNGKGYHTNKLKFLTKFILDINNFYASCFGNKQSCSEKNGKNAIHCVRVYAIRLYHWLFATQMVTWILRREIKL